MKPSMRFSLLFAAVFAATQAADNMSYCPDLYKEFEWTTGNGSGIVCRCEPAESSGLEYSDCYDNMGKGDCESADPKGDGSACAWNVFMWSQATLEKSPPENVNPTGKMKADGTPWVNDGSGTGAAGTVTDCNGTVFTASECAYRNKQNCMDYIGDGICDFGQRFTKKGVRSGPNFSCEDFGWDGGDCNCPDTMTCDGYCLDKEACKSDDHDDCASWMGDSVCDYGQRTSTFGVSINFDCNIDDTIATIPNDALKHGHDSGACTAWNWSDKYSEEELLEKFKAECPVGEPTEAPVDAPVVYCVSTACPAGQQHVDGADMMECVDGKCDAANCCEDKAIPEPAKCSTFKAEGCAANQQLIANAGGVEGDSASACCEAKDPPVVGPVDCNSYSKKPDCLEESLLARCFYDKNQPKGLRCKARVEDECTFRLEKATKKLPVGTWDKKKCLNATGCIWSRRGPSRTIYEDGSTTECKKRVHPKTGAERCTVLADFICWKEKHSCNAITKVNSCKKSYEQGKVCKWQKDDDGSSYCMSDPGLTCAMMKKKTQCKAHNGNGDLLHCRYGRKVNRDAPEGIPSGQKCWNASRLCDHGPSLEGVKDFEGPCPDKGAANYDEFMTQLQYVKPPKTKKWPKTGGCAKMANKNKCNNEAEAHGCTWDKTTDPPACFEGTLGGGR